MIPTRATRPASEWYAELSEYLPAAYVAGHRHAIEAYRLSEASPAGTWVACRIDLCAPMLCPGDYAGPVMAPAAHPADTWDGLASL